MVFLLVFELSSVFCVGLKVIFTVLEGSKRLEAVAGGRLYLYVSVGFHMWMLLGRQILELYGRFDSIARDGYALLFPNS